MIGADYSFYGNNLYDCPPRPGLQRHPFLLRHEAEKIQRKAGKGA